MLVRLIHSIPANFQHTYSIWMVFFLVRLFSYGAKISQNLLFVEYSTNFECNHSFHLNTFEFLIDLLSLSLFFVCLFLSFPLSIGSDSTKWRTHNINRRWRYTNANITWKRVSFWKIRYEFRCFRRRNAKLVSEYWNQ